MTQRQVAETLGVSAQAVSKWERGLGCPDTGLLPGISRLFGVSAERLLSGNLARERIDGGNMKRIKFYVCPDCGNILTASGGGELHCCGRKLEALKPQVRKLECVPHRLELKDNGSAVIIDDAYNSNESGFISAINLVSSYKNKIKIVITPGVVELGKVQSEINDRLARYASERVDYLFTYGVNADAIKRGAGAKCEICSSLNECMKRYKSIQGERVVLFENDLRDTY
jgi:UDP-N-acetylmuramyl pentapeptide synthase/DNA-binding XRE family transcriptional regulator